MEHYGIKLCSMVLGMGQVRTLWYKVVQHGVGMSQDRELWYKVVLHGVAYGAA